MAFKSSFWCFIGFGVMVLHRISRVIFGLCVVQGRMVLTSRLASSSVALGAIVKPTDLFSQWAEVGRDEKMVKGHEAPVASIMKSLDPLLPPSYSFLDIGMGNGSSSSSSI